MENKSILYSKTVWVALAYAALISFEGPIQEYIKSHQNISGYLVSFVFILLRILTKSGVRFL